MNRLILVFLAIGVSFSSATLGIDTIAVRSQFDIFRYDCPPNNCVLLLVHPLQAISTSGFQCLASSGYWFYIGRVGQSNGGIDQTGIQNIKNAWSGGELMYSQVCNGVNGCMNGCIQTIIINVFSCAITNGYLWKKHENFWGMGAVDAYLFPCHSSSCGSAKTQVRFLVIFSSVS